MRDTYLRECAHRTSMKENTLIAQMNRFIYNDKEQQRKEQQRENRKTGKQSASFKSGYTYSAGF